MPPRGFRQYSQAWSSSRACGRVLYDDGEVVSLSSLTGPCVQVFVVQAAGSGLKAQEPPLTRGPHGGPEPSPRRPVAGQSRAGLSLVSSRVSLWPPSTAVQLQSPRLSRGDRHETHSAFCPHSRPLSRFFSPLCFSEGLRGGPELVGEEVFPRNGSMLCVRAAALTGLTFSGFALVLRSLPGAWKVSPWRQGGWGALASKGPGSGWVQCRQNRGES